MIAYELVVSGVVQGVGFRHYTREQAELLGVHGTVRNLADGRVKIHVEGEDELIRKFIEWCHSGPPTATVSKLEYSPSKVGGFSTFDILRV